GGQRLVHERRGGDEQRHYEVVDREPRLPGERAERRAPAKTPQAGRRIRAHAQKTTPHAASRRAPRVASSPKIAPSPASQTVSCKIVRHGGLSNSAAAKKRTACTNRNAFEIHPARGTISFGTST